MDSGSDSQTAPLRGKASERGAASDARTGGVSDERIAPKVIAAAVVALVESRSGRSEFDPAAAEAAIRAADRASGLHEY